MKYTILVTQACNLACAYCYVGKRPLRMSLNLARKIVDFAYARTPASETIELGLFGGEPLLEFDLVQQITELVVSHPAFESRSVDLTLVSNGTIFSSQIADFVNRHDMGFGISCDGPPDVHNGSRRFPDGRPTAQLVERTIRQALDAFGTVMVNAVYGPESLEHLPRTVEYFSGLGVRQIYLSPDFTARWTRPEIEGLPAVYEALASRYVDYYRRGDPHFISPIDSKIAVVLRGGYHPLERCRMGRAEFAFTPTGAIFPCERLVGDGANGHCIGTIEKGIDLERIRCHDAAGGPSNPECAECSLRSYCMNWCGCSNFFMSGHYNRVSAFLCAAEKAAIRVAYETIQTLEREDPGRLFDHMSAAPAANGLVNRGGWKP